MLFGFFMPFSSHTCFTMPKSPYFLRQMALRVSPRIMVYDVGCVAVCVVPVVPVVVQEGNESVGVISGHGMQSEEYHEVVPVVREAVVQVVEADVLVPLVPVVVPFTVAVLPLVRAVPFVAVPAVFPSSMPVV